MRIFGDHILDLLTLGRALTETIKIAKSVASKDEEALKYISNT